MNDATAALLRKWFKRLNRWLMIPMWRLGLGKPMNIWPSVGGRILVLAHTGRKSGLRRLTPLNYAPSPPSSVFVLAGFGTHTDWYQNALANPAVEVWLPDGRWLAEAIDVSDHPLRMAILRDVLVASGFAAPLAGVNPRRLSDQELEEMTADYRLIELQYRADATGTHGPGDLSWIWVAAAALWLMDRVRRR
jgi:deazaflavin-dependent oxidoreductase (nitroreductase family)